MNSAWPTTLSANPHYLIWNGSREGNVFSIDWTNGEEPAEKVAHCISEMIPSKVQKNNESTI